MKYELILDETVYSLNSLMKAAYRFTDTCYFYFKRGENKNITIEFTPKDSNSYKEIVDEFKNVILHEKIREEVFKETKNIRELLLSRAIYGLAIEESDVQVEETDKNIDFENLKVKGSYKTDTIISKSRY